MELKLCACKEEKKERAREQVSILCARHNARCWEMREFHESRIMPRVLTWQKGWIEMSSTKWGNLRKQFPEAAVFRESVCGGVIVQLPRVKNMYIFCLK